MIERAQWYEKFMKSSLKRRFIEKLDKLWGVESRDVSAFDEATHTRSLFGRLRRLFSVFIYARGEILSCLFGKRIRRTSLE